MTSWIDNADSYICPICGFETNNPNRFYGKCPKCGFIDTNDVRAVDVVEVVRCNDCIHTRKKNAHEQFMYNEDVCICTKENIWGITQNEPVWSDGFCSSGERKCNG